MSDYSELDPIPVRRSMEDDEPAPRPSETGDEVPQQQDDDWDD